MIALPLVALDVLVIALWTIAAALAIALIMDKLAAILSGVPAVGGWLAGHVRGMAQAITNACGHLLGGIDHLIGAAWSALSHYLNTMFSQFVAHSALIAHLAELVAGGLYRVTGLRAIVHRLDKAVHVVLHRFTTMGREIYRLGRRVKTLEREIGKGIGHDLRIHIKALERWEKAAKAQLESDAQAITETIPAEIGQIKDWLGIRSGINYKTWAAALATALLASIGLGGLRCNSNPFKNNPNACGLWGDLADILGLVVAAELALNFDELVHSAQEVAEVTTTAVQDVFGLSG